ncbi:uncharacterized protein I206_107192 [Kwoniella pini CBS 10737]|uniref:RING-type domain-containing protein n=1 Tax=Kwoniella pini CBS 10737 TaxID=1296096 RepID=A0A1B9HZ10_9TREE|nr:uncharacterized protein I206_05263 [Kwoniella pini CBS 10737]OCF48484.1 hypothetical protein I206_05263 [Kwoniella pini CBS 10737]
MSQRDDTASGLSSPPNSNGKTRRPPFLGLTGPSISSPITTLSSTNAIAGPSSQTSVKKERSTNQGGPRVIRTFEEIKVPVKSEEWYEELECAICSQILGATQTIVPCGHSFCGPCSWKWIKSNDHPSCPSCRMKVSDTTPLIPNIMVDQIIDRKLANLPDGAEKSAMMIERKEKAQAWKVIQASMPPVKAPPPKRPRGLDDIMHNLIDIAAPMPIIRSGHARRASRQLVELGAPIDAISAEEADAVARLRSERIQERLSEMRRLREERIRVLSDQVAANRNAEVMAQNEDVEMPDTSRGNQRSPAQPQMATSYTPPLPPLRSFSMRSPALARRQARGRDSGTRDDPLVVLSDEE